MEEIPLQSYIYSAVKKAQARGVNIDYQRTDTSIVVVIDGVHFPFQGSKSPFNSEASDKFIDDKWEVARALRLRVDTPHTEFFPKNTRLTTDEIISYITERIESETHPFTFPIVIKPNNGSLSENVHIAHNAEEIKIALEENLATKQNGDKILIQQYVGPAKEYRVICLNGQCQFAYEKNIDDAIEGQKANPIYWVGSKPVLVTDPNLLKQFDKIGMALYQDHGVHYVGLDVRVDENGIAWTLEGNSSPMGLKRVIFNVEGGQQLIDKLCDSMIAKMQQIAKFTNRPVLAPNQKAYGPATPR